MLHVLSFICTESLGMQRLNTIVSGLVLRRTKEEMGPELLKLTKRVVETHQVQLKPAEQQVYDALFFEARYILPCPETFLHECNPHSYSYLLTHENIVSMKLHRIWNTAICCLVYTFATRIVPRQDIFLHQLLSLIPYHAMMFTSALLLFLTAQESVCQLAA